MTKLFILLAVTLALIILYFFFFGNGNKFMEGFTSESGSITFTSPDGSTAVVSTDYGTIVITKTDGSTVTYTQTKTNDGTYATTYMFSGSNGGTALLTIGKANKNMALITKDVNGSNQITFTLVTTPNTDGSSSSSSSSSSTTSGTTTTTSGTDYDNYNHYDGSSYPTIFYGPNGGTIKLVKTPTNNTLVITNKNGTTEIYSIDTNDTTYTTYYGPNGGSAKIIDSNGKKAIEVTTANGSKLVYTGDNAYTYNSQDGTINQYSADSNTTGADYNTAYIPPTYPATSGTSTYDAYLPPGIPRSQIPAGQEDLYILKSQVVPPVCPKCPDPIVQCPDNNDTTKCPPCPACARCPEPAFDCKKVPNYKAFNQNYMPMPVLSDFSSFGM